MRDVRTHNNCKFVFNIIMNPRLFIFIFLLLPGAIYAQNAYNFKISTDRMLFHDLVDKEQKALLNEKDSIKVSTDDAVNLQVGDVFIRQVDELQQQIEMDTGLNGQMKVKSLGHQNITAHLPLMSSLLIILNSFPFSIATTAFLLNSGNLLPTVTKLLINFLLFFIWFTIKFAQRSS